MKTCNTTIQGGYNSTPIVIPGTCPPPHHTPPLPFTGLDVGLMGLVAIGLLGMGKGLRRLTRPKVQ